MPAPSHMPHLVEIDGIVIARCSCGAVGIPYDVRYSGEYHARKDAMAHLSKAKLSVRQLQELFDLQVTS